MYTPREEDLVTGIKSLGYEVSEMVKNALQLLEHQHVQDASNNVYLEACLTHARNLNEFLGKPKRPDKNQDYPTSLATDFGFPPRFPMPKQTWSRISGSLSHMTYPNRTHVWNLQTIITPILKQLRCFAESIQVQTSVGESRQELQELRVQLETALATVGKAFAERDKTCFSTSSDITS